jgi:hypothetical protein
MKLPFVIRDRNIQGNFDRLGQLLGLEKLRIGSGTLTFPGGSTFTSETTVTHGLGTTPRAVLVTGTFGASMVSVNDVGATTFDALGCTIDGSTPAAATAGTFFWLAAA